MKANGNRQVEDRLARLEKELDRLRTDLRHCKQAGWRTVVGSHQGSKTFDQIIRAIRRHRRDDYAKTSAPRAKRKSVQKAAMAEE